MNAHSALSQREKLENIIRAAERALVAAEHGHLFGDRRGLALVNAIHDLLEVDAIYDLARDIERECGIGFERPEMLGDSNLVGREINDRNWARSAA